MMIWNFFRRRSWKFNAGIIVLCSVLLIVGWMTFVRWFFTDGETATRLLRQENYSEIQITGYRYWGCGSDDSFHTGFKAIAPNGDPVRGVVCSGWLKGGTIRVF